MAESKDLKPKSFRIDEQTAEKFKEIANQIGGNQQETLAKLIESYEMQAGKEVLTDRKADIEQFDGHITAITRKYMAVLEDHQNVREAVKAEFEAQLKSKDSVIQDLQQRLEKAEQEKATSETLTASYRNENTSLSEKVTELEKSAETTKSMLDDKADIITNLKAELEKGKNALEESKRMKEELEEFKEQCKALEQEKASIELAHKQEILGLRQGQQEKIEKLKQKQQAQIDSYQSKYLELLDKINQGQGIKEKPKTERKRGAKQSEEKKQGL